MQSLNNVTLVGRLVKDPDLRKTNDGKSVSTVRLAVDLPPQNGNDNPSMFIDVTFFGQQAEFLAKYFRKGSLAGITGRLTQRRYLSNKTNTEVTVTEIIGNNVCFVGPKSAESDASGNAEQPTAETHMETKEYVEPKVESKTVGIDVIDDDLPF